MPAKMLAAAAALGEAHGPGRTVGQLQMGVVAERRQARAVGDPKRDLVEVNLGGGLPGRIAIAQLLGERQQAWLELAPKDALYTELPKQTVIDRGVQTVDTKVGPGGCLTDPGDGFHGNACRGMHRNIDANQAGRTKWHLGECLLRQIHAPYREARITQPGRWFGDSERLSAEFIGVDENDAGGRRVSVYMEMSGTRLAH